MAYLVTRGLVLREVNYKESDKILTILAEGQGKQTVKAGGCRRKNSPIAAASQLLVWSDMTLFEYRNRRTLHEAVTLDEFRGVRKDLEKFSLSAYFAETVEAVAEEGVETPGLLPLTLNSLYALDKLEKPLPLVKAAFELKLSCLAGYEPLLNACAVCGIPEPEEPWLDLAGGVLSCAQCRRKLGRAGPSMPLDAPALAALRYVAYGNPRRLFSFTLPPGSQNLFSNVCESFLLSQLERGFRTLEFYKSICRNGEGNCT